MSCDENIELEELTIEWLHVSGDEYLSVPLIKVILFIAALSLLIMFIYSLMQHNLGSNNTFVPLCAFNDEFEFHQEIIVNADGTEGIIETEAFN